MDQELTAPHVERRDVVDHQHRGLRAVKVQSGLDCSQHGELRGAGIQAADMVEGVGYQRGQRREGDASHRLGGRQPDPPPTLLAERLDDPFGQAGLADTTRTGEQDGADRPVRGELGGSRQLPLPADERRLGAALPHVRDVSGASGAGWPPTHHVPDARTRTT